MAGVGRDLNLIADVEKDDDKYAQLATNFLTARMGRKVQVEYIENWARAACGIPSRQCHAYLQTLDGKGCFVFSTPLVFVFCFIASVFFFLANLVSCPEKRVGSSGDELR